MSNARKRERKQEIADLVQAGRDAYAAGRHVQTVPREHIGTMNRMHWEGGWLAARDEAEEAKRSEWDLLDYENGENGCPHCGRHRLCKCPNGMRRCEKCNWSPELNDYVPVD